MMETPNLTMSELHARMKQMDHDVLHCLDCFLSDTGVAVVGLNLSFDEESEEYLIDWHFAFLEE
jgi:hypothetical protein